MEGYQASGGLKDTGLRLTYLDPDGVDVCVNSVKITVLTVDLDIDGVADEAETTIGGFIALNNDDDDNNGTADKDANGPITGEDNLVKITLQKVEPTALTGTVTLKANSGGSKIKVWTSSTKGTEVTLPKTYSTPSALPKDLWVEGYSGSSSVRDIELALEYTVEGQTFDDKVKFTVISIDSIMVDGSDTTTHNIESVLGSDAHYDEHLVTPKGTGNIILNAGITPDTTETRNKITWTGMTQDATNKLKATKSRATSGKYSGTINVSGDTAKDFANWVVWSTCNALSFSKTTGVATVETGDSTSGPGRYIRITVTSDFAFTISLGSICTDSDRPALQGANSGAANVPNGTDTHVIYGTALSGGVNAKWDESRQIRVKVLNPNLYTKNQLAKNSGHIFDGQPAASDIPEAYPGSEVVGNDDQGTGDPEDNNPYSVDVGKLKGADDPSVPMRNSTGSDGDTFEIRYHFTEFTRLELGTTWYRISDPVYWRAHYKFKRVSGAWTDDGSSGAADNSGW